MKIGIISYPTQGGSGVVATELAMALARRGHSVHLFSYAHPFRLPRFQRNLILHEVEVSTYPLFKYPPYDLALAARLAEVVEEAGLQILHAHYAVPHATSAWLAKQLVAPRPVRVVTTLHGTDITLVGTDPAYFRVVRFSILQSDRVTAVSQSLRRQTQEEFGIGRDIVVVPNFVDTKRFRDLPESSERRVFAPNGEPILAHASNFRPLKRVGDVLRIFARVRTEMPAKLLLIGQGPDRIFAQRLAKDLGVEADVHFLGEQEFPERLYACADLFLLPSEQESFGLSALEAMSCGVPVIATRVGGLPELIEDGKTGFLFPVGDVEGMAQAALRLLRDPELRHAMARDARRIACEKYDQERVVDLYEELYRELIAGS
jgi:N-acetyl-alpha-D-glucosaminyl L-malate synthase BshA